MLPLYATDEVEQGNFSKISISLASPDTILSWSHGEVTKPETINYRSYKPEKDGLFCEKIFGPVKDWECHCGKYRGIRYKGIVCDRCGVEVTKKDVRRKRMGHISLAVPVVHIWYFRSLPSKISYVLNISTRDLERIIYYESFAVIQPGRSALRRKDLLSEAEYLDVIAELGPQEDVPAEERFVAKMGGEAVRDLLATEEIDTIAGELRAQIKTETSAQRKHDAIKKLRVIEAFKDQDASNFNRPEWMVMSVVPVVPPDLRPLVPLEGGRFATSDLNDLYRRVIIRNNRLKRLIEIRAPEVILRNEKRMLQEAVDSLFDNGRKSVAVRSDGNRPLKSLSDNLKGKQGRFRQNLLGKRVDYSGRSVIVVGPELRLYQCGLPKDMAVELFKPFIIRKLIEYEHTKTVKSAKRLVERKTDEVWAILEEIIQDHPVLLNRAPTLHRLGIQAFQPLLIEGKAIRLHPLVCSAFNADFDGDQMAVHVPLSYEAQVEARLLMMANHNVLHPAHGRPITVPSQDMVLGLYYLTKRKVGEPLEWKTFSSPEELIVARNDGKIGLHTQIRVRIRGMLVETTVGRVIFNRILPPQVQSSRYFNEMLAKKRIEEIIYQCILNTGIGPTAVFLDRLKELGFTQAMMAGISVGLSDVEIPSAKDKLIEAAYKKVEEVQNQYEDGIITDGERYNKIIDIWTHTSTDVAEVMFSKLRDAEAGFNPIFMMADSGARGSKEQIRQLAGMRGLMAKPQKSLTGQKGEIIESPITANFKEGLSVLEYFISTHGARKGLADTALKTADAGYLTRRLVDVAQDVIVRDVDCGTLRGIFLEEAQEGEEVTEQLHERVMGRVLSEPIFDPVTGEKILDANTVVKEREAAIIAKAGVTRLKIRSVLTCESVRGVCAMCYGTNLATGNMVDMGEAVGVMAAQSVGEPGTQLTLRTFHIGGAASRDVSESRREAKRGGRVTFENVDFIEREDGAKISIRRSGLLKILDENNRQVARYKLPYGAQVFVKEAQTVVDNELLFEWDPYSDSILASTGGTVHYVDIREDVTFHQMVDEQTGMKHKVIIESKDRKLNPHVVIVGPNGERLANHILPISSHLLVSDGDPIKTGEPLAKMPRKSQSIRDITGGLPRVTELFEARRPKDPATVAEIDGIVRFGGLKRGVRMVTVTSLDGQTERKYAVPYGKHILVHDHDRVSAGEKITEGSVVPQDILAIQGAWKVQEYLVKEIQEVYRSQGVRINDKHIEVIVRQMLQKVRIEDPGDTDYLEGDHVDGLKFIRANEKMLNKIVVEELGDAPWRMGNLVEKTDFNRENRKLRTAGGMEAKGRPAKPATSTSVLLGITQASLSTESFISAASFQETTRVLTDAAISKKTDLLSGLKENVIMGHLIPAGTGLAQYHKLRSRRPTEEEEELAKDFRISAPGISADTVERGIEELGSEEMIPEKRQD
ncbi:DNA-directed RNA polymerase subunit beta' [candidate division KSB1 bacterium]|nr:DNA-directed RNA polymerase subunit beta' [candidate division KSB1 bacterium]